LPFAWAAEIRTPSLRCRWLSVPRNRIHPLSVAPGLHRFPASFASASNVAHARSGQPVL